MRRIWLIALAAVALAGCHTERTSASSEPRQQPSGAVRESGPLLSYADVVDRVAPAVVTIRSSKRVRAPQMFPFFDDPLFREFFGGGSPRRRGGGTEVERALGSGVVVRADGHILTNHHVVDGAEDIRVEFTASKRGYSAKLVGSDPPSDLAVLKISASGLPVLQLGDSDKVRVGDVCLAVGNPLGVGESVTAGIISAKGRSTDVVGGGSFQDFLQTDAPINQGNSGGALVNTRGELIGINSQILSSNGGNIGIGFAIPSNMARNVMQQLIGKGAVQRGMLGVGIQPVTSDMVSGLGLKATRGVIVNSVTPGGPAEKAGIKTGDVILQVNGKDVNDANVLRNTIAGTAPGTEVTLTISRNGAQQQVRARLGTLNDRASAGDSDTGGSAGGGTGGGGEESAARLGITIAPMNSQLAAQLRLPRSTPGMVVTEVDPNGSAANVGIQAGDVIQEVNRQPVRSAGDLRAALQKSGRNPAVLLINRQGQTAFVAVP